VWSSYNYPTSMSVPGGTATVSYGPARQYVQTVMPHPSGGNTETIRYIGEALQRRTRGTVTDWRHVVYVGAEAVAIISRQSTGTNTVRYRLSDHQGSTAVLASSSGAVLLKESFGAYGGARNGNTWTGGMSTADQATMVEISRQGYTGHTMLGFGGLIHMNGRVQDSVTGRFLSPDPYVTEPGHTQGYNRYAYVRNNPASFVDPSGYDLADLLQWLCNTSTGMCPPIAVPWELEEVTVSARRFVQDTQEVIRELLRQQQEGAVAQQAAGEVGGGSVGVGEAAEGMQGSVPPCKYGPSEASGSVKVDFYAGVGGGGSTGVDDGHTFAQGRAGFGVGGGATYQPTGGIPVKPAEPYSSGNQITYSAQADLTVGIPGTPIAFSLGFEGGYNIDTNSGGGWFANFNPEWGFESSKGMHAGANVGASVTGYGPSFETMKVQGTCRLQASSSSSGN
jgi:RHS repeat-associated protein